MSCDSTLVQPLSRSYTLSEKREARYTITGDGGCSLLGLSPGSRSARPSHNAWAWHQAFHLVGNGSISRSWWVPIQRYRFTPMLEGVQMNWCIARSSALKQDCPGFISMQMKHAVDLKWLLWILQNAKPSSIANYLIKSVLCWSFSASTVASACGVWM